jgi:hypothetical protein
MIEKGFGNIQEVLSVMSAQKCRKILQLQGNLCYHAIAEAIDFNKRNFWGFSPGIEVPNNFLTRVAKPAA